MKPILLEAAEVMRLFAETTKFDRPQMPLAASQFAYIPVRFYDPEITPISLAVNTCKS